MKDERERERCAFIPSAERMTSKETTHKQAAKDSEGTRHRAAPPWSLLVFLINSPSPQWMKLNPESDPGLVVLRGRGGKQRRGGPSKTCHTCCIFAWSPRSFFLSTSLISPYSRACTDIAGRHIEMK